ncbi:MAG: amino acid permease, partial [Planctomycetes bacterium]|nr:amino acid permease [Planctomycetota bacterium]
SITDNAAAHAAAGSTGDAEQGIGRPRRELGLWDCIAIIVGIIVGAGIFSTAPFIASKVSAPGMLYLAWGLGGVLSIIGALCYAELATTYPREGGDYVYLNRAYGPWAGFLFAWARLSIIHTGSIGSVAYVFAAYAANCWQFGSNTRLVYAALAVLLLSGLNILGLRAGKWMQNVLTVAKILGLAGIVLAALVSGGNSNAPVYAGAWQWQGFPLAMVLILYTYGGWEDAAYVAAEVRDPRHNIVRSLLIGTALVMVLYLLVNGAYLYALGLQNLRTSETVAASVVATALGQGHYERLPVLVMSVVVIISTLGSVNGGILTGARISYAMGCEHRLFGLLGRWGRRTSSPVWALVAQGLVTLGLVVLLAGGEGGEHGFEILIKFVSPVFWLFFLMTAVSLFVLRWRDAAVERPFRVPLYPVLPLVFCCSCGFMLYNSINYALAVRVSAELRSLPADFHVPASLEGQLAFSGEDEERSLTFNGVMSSASRDQLLALGPEFEYQQAIQELYARSQRERNTALWAGGILLTGLPLYWLSRTLGARVGRSPSGGASPGA